MQEPLGPTKLFDRNSPRAPLHLRATPPAQRLLGDWELVERITHTERSLLFVARPTHAVGSRNDSDYVIKQLTATDRGSVERFRREAALGRQLTHPNLLPLLAAQTHQPPHYLVMPRIRGATLGEVLREHGRFETGQAIWIARQLVDAIAYLHEWGWIHSDIKPDNVLISFSGHVTLFDLGLAVSLKEAAQSDYDAFHGTIAFAAPELFLSKRRLSPASDIYSLGATIYNLLTGKPPFEHRRPEQLARAHLDAVPPSVRTYVPQVSSSISRLIGRMLAKDPARRPTSNELQLELLRLEVDAFQHRCSLASNAG